MNKAMTVLAAGTAALMIPAHAEAATITYTFTGDFTGTLNGSAFSNAATFTGVGDTDTSSMSGLTQYVALSSLSAVIGGTSYTILSPTNFYLNGADYAGLQFTVTGGGAFSGTGPALVGYDPLTNLPSTPLTAYFVGPVSFISDQGTFTLDGFANGSFSAELAAAVPEPATWAMLILGFGVVGAFVRRQRKVTTTVRFA